jgi:tripartite-type tricarboxylate transporter receptor subunit TctC
VFLPAGTPPEIGARLNAEINAALTSPEIIARVTQLGGETVHSTQAEFNQFYRAEIERWKDVVVRTKVKIE